MSPMTNRPFSSPLPPPPPAPFISSSQTPTTSVERGSDVGFTLSLYFLSASVEQ